MSQAEKKRALSDEDLLPAPLTQADVAMKKNGKAAKPLRELSRPQQLKRILLDYVFMLCLFLGFLYLFICSLSVMGSAFQLLGGKDAGRSLSQNELFDNPVAGLVLGVLATVLLQSSSTTTSIIITMTSAGLLTVEQAIFMVMGANIGTSVTNTIVAMGQIKDRAQFELAFAGATVHDMFNILTVCVLLPIEAATHYLLALTTAIVDTWHLETDTSQKIDFLKKLTLPLTNRIVQIDKTVISKIARGELRVAEARLLKETCFIHKSVIENCSETTTTTPGLFNVSASNIAVVSSPATTLVSTTATTVMNETDSATNVSCTLTQNSPCDYLFHSTSLSDSAVGAILLVCSLVVLCASLIFMVKILSRLLQGRIAESTKKFVNAEFPGKAAYFTGYVAILVGAGLTILVQSSSVFTSAITPLVGLGIIDLERMYPLTLGANVGTTVTGILAGLASVKVEQALKVAMAHLFFNLSGILIWYVVPFMRKPPINAARYLGKTTAKYRWFAILYIIVAFFLIPLAIFGLSLAGWEVLVGVGVPTLLVLIFIIGLNVIQRKKPAVLPEVLRTWDFLPLALRSLEPIDSLIWGIAVKAPCACCSSLGRDQSEFSSSSECSNEAGSSTTFRLGTLETSV